MTVQLRVDPRIVRDVLAAAATTDNENALARRFGYNRKTIVRWIRCAEANPGWPTDRDVEAWDAALPLAKKRARAAALQRDYKKRRYLVGGEPMMIGSTGTVRRLQALAAIGWTWPQIGERLGVTPARVGHLASGMWVKVHRHTAGQVAALYDALSMTIPQDHTSHGKGQVYVHDRQRRAAAKKGWLPPLAWDDDIDDPAAQPTIGADTNSGGGLPWAELLDEWEFLTESCGLSKPEALARLGVTDDALRQARKKRSAADAAAARPDGEEAA